MAYTTTQLITGAYYLSGITARLLQSVTGDQLTDGLDLLNDMLSMQSVNQRMIPYFKQHDFDGVVGQELYFIENMIEIQTLTFNIGDVRYSMMPVERKIYFGAGRVNNVESLPFNYHMERVLGGSNLYVYYLPNQVYTFSLWGKFALDQAALGQDLSQIYDRFYITYMKYLLAEYICSSYNVVFQPQSAEKLRQFEKTLRDLSPYDLATQKLSTLQQQPGYNYADANIGMGYRP